MASVERTLVAFVGTDLVARGTEAEVAPACAALVDSAGARIAIFDDDTGRAVDLDLSAPAQSAHDADGERRGPGRPKLGVVSREVSLLPRHWEWLGEQRGGASATLRRLVDAARKEAAHEGDVRSAVDAAHKFLWDIAGDISGFEEASRALFARDFDELETLTSEWPPGIVEQLARFVARARSAQAAAQDSGSARAADDG